MSTTRNAPRLVMTASFTMVLVLAIVLWAATVANTMTLKSSDAAGNGLSYAFGVLIAIALWVLLAILIILAATRGKLPGWMAIAAVVLVPAAGAATIGSIVLMSQNTEWPVKWPLIIPVLAPAMVVAIALWTFVPSLRASAPASLVGAVVWGSLALLSIAPWPLVRERAHLRRAGPGELQALRAERRGRWRASDRDAWRARFESIDDTEPLYAWLPFTEPGDPMRDRALDRIRRLPDRQREVEEVVRAGNVAAVREIPNFGVDASPALCEAAREAVMFHARRVRPDESDVAERAAGYARYARDIEFYMPSVEWLVQRGCSLEDGIAELEMTANAYPDSPERARFLASLAALRRSAAASRAR